jgi:hypothetical protein
MCPSNYEDRMSGNNNFKISTGIAVIAILVTAGIAKVFFGQAEPKSSHAAVVSRSRFLTFGQDLRFTPTTRPYQPVPQIPPLATTQNSDTGKPAPEWQRLTGEWAGARPWLDDHGVAIDGSLATYFGDNLMGGATTSHGGFSYLLNINVTLDSKKLLGYDGGSFFVNFRDQNGLRNSLDRSDPRPTFIRRAGRRSRKSGISSNSGMTRFA